MYVSHGGMGSATFAGRESRLLTHFVILREPDRVFFERSRDTEAARLAAQERILDLVEHFERSDRVRAGNAFLAEESVVNRRREAVSCGIAEDREYASGARLRRAPARRSAGGAHHSITSVNRQRALERELTGRGDRVPGDEHELRSEERREDARVEAALAHADHG